MTRYAGSNSQPNMPSTDKPSTMNMPTGAIFSKPRAQPRRQNTGQHAAAVERRNRQQIEYRQHDVDQNAGLSHEQRPSRPRSHRRLMRSTPRQHGAPQKRHEKIRGGPGKRHHDQRRGADCAAPLVATGTGFAQPKSGTPIASSSPGISTVPTGSIWRSGFKLRRPSSSAVRSPKYLRHPAMRHLVQGDGE